MIADMSADEGDRSGIAALHQALDLLELSDPRRFQRLQQHVRALQLVTLSVFLGRYKPGSRTCQLDRRAVLDRPTIETAATIVHEATHAVLSQRGIGYGREIRDRVERLCRLEELRFLKRAGASRDALERAEAALAQPSLSDYQLLEAETRYMRANGIPPFLARILTAPRRVLLRIRG